MWSPPTILLLWAWAATALYLPPGARAGPATTSGGAWTFPTNLELERGFPRRGVAMEELVARDRARHARGRNLLGSSSPAAGGVLSLPVDGAASPRAAGLYFTRVKLGNPWKELFVQIDTGSDIMWVTCSPCNGCPTSSGLNIQLERYEPEKSATSSQIPCGDDRCTSALQVGYASCSSSNSSSAPCHYTFKYGDGSVTSGYYVADELYFSSVSKNGQVINSSAPIVFGCSNSQSGDLSESHTAVDGIIGFGQHELSFISQLSAAGVAPMVFSHCLNGSDTGGGILVLGGIIEPGIVYTPIIPSLAHYNLNLESISVNGQALPIDPSIFATSNTQGTIIDSGTTLAYLVEQAYDPLINAIMTSLSSSVHSIDGPRGQCFITLGSIDESFPIVTLKFMGGASMRLKPENYLLHEADAGSSSIWCMGWKKTSSGVTVLGDIVLKDKIFTYDLVNQQIGWSSHDCQQCSCFQSVTVTTASGRSMHLNTGQFEVSGSPVSAPGKQLSTIILALVYIATLASLWR